MNSIKNAIVTMTLLAVGYGAYVVLNEPAPQDSLDQLATGDDWQPAVTGIDGQASGPPNVSVDGVVGQVGDAIDAGVASLNQAADAGLDRIQDFQEGDPLPPLDPPNSLSQMRDELTDVADRAAGRYGDSANTLAEGADALLGRVANGARNAMGTADDVASGLADSGSNFYANRVNDGEMSGDGRSPSYPNTGAPELPFQSAAGGSPDLAASARDDNDGSRASTYDYDNGSYGRESGFAATWKSVEADLNQGQLGNALLALSAWYESPDLSPSERTSSQQLLDQLAGSVIYSNESFIDSPHVVQAGETLASLSEEYQVPIEFLARINGIDPPGRVFPGETLKVLRGPFRAELNRETSYVVVFLGRYYAGRFQARIGDGLPSGETSYEVAAIEDGHEFFDRRSGQRFSEHDPANPYGGRWISLRGDQITSAHNVGIHADTGDDRSCCIAVSPSDADDLSSILSVGSRVTVVR